MSTLHHEHLVRINDPNIAAQWLTRSQLWAGLRHTILAPELFDPSIDRATVRPLTADQVSRELQRGPARVVDRVVFASEESLTIHADLTSTFAGSTLRIDIEEPAPGMLFVRFTYDVVGLEIDRTEEEDAARRSAYQQSDIERIRQARRFVAAGGCVH